MAWVNAAFRGVGANPTIGTQLSLAGLVGVQTFGIQSCYLATDDPRGPALLSGVVRTLGPQIVAAGLATTEQIDIDTLAQRIAASFQASGSVFLPPALVGAWGRRH